MRRVILKTIDLLIPTYNRCSFLEKNIDLLLAMIDEINSYRRINIIISNNNSTDETYIYLNGLKNENIKIYHQVENIGLEKNALYCLDKSDSDYVMYIGDDDYISKEYLKAVLNEIDSNSNVSLIVPSFISVNEYGDKVEGGRDIGLKYKKYKKSFLSTVYFTYRGHQLSGLTLLRSDLYKSYVSNNVFNLYPFVYFALSSSLKGDSVHLPIYPIKVTKVTQNKKDWNYGKDGLIDHMFNNFKCCPNISLWERVILEQFILFKQSWRINVSIQNSKIDFLKSVLSSKNTTIITKLSYIFHIPLVVFIGKLK